MNPGDMIIRGMARAELDTLVEWAAREGWNPGLDDAEVFWATDPDGFVAAEIDGELVGYAVMRPCRRGFGPLFAASAAVAERLYRALSSRVPGEAIFLDVPENNPEALALARRHGMQEVFGCARMVLGPVPELPDAEIFGVTTFELG